MGVVSLLSSSEGLAPAGSALAVISTVLFTSVGIYGWCQLIRLWFNPDREELLIHRMMNGLGRGDRDRSRGHVRSLLPISIIIANLCFDAGMLNYAALYGEFPGEWVGMVIMGTLAANLVLLALWGTILLFNRPRFLVAPSMRADPGFLAVKRARRLGPEAVNQLYEDAREC